MIHIEGYVLATVVEERVAEMLSYLPTDMPVVVTGWTGQTSSQVTAYLNTLGYDAYSLKFGFNALFHADLTGHKWNGTVNTYPFDVLVY